MPNRPIPEATVARLPIYLRALLDLAEQGRTGVSSDDLARMAGVNAAKVRKDLSYLGSYGTRGVGYDVEYLLYQITRELGLTQDWPAALIGAGNLGRALASYKGFSERGFRIAALLDIDDAVVGDVVGGLTVRHLDDLKEAVVDENISIGIITTPPAAAQEVADRLVDAGIKSILNFAPAVVNVPPDVQVRKVDLAIELQILSFHMQRMQAIATAREANRRLGGR
ncbi:MAG TPA: redox-sensing transcriptional repressor Rex [Actinomycetota bacterium]|nr:redox-sensing transcriptional repressor Rex [Actinomycetota bacterium]